MLIIIKDQLVIFFRDFKIPSFFTVTDSAKVELASIITTTNPVFKPAAHFQMRYRISHLFRMCTRTYSQVNIYASFISRASKNTFDIKSL